MSANDRVAALSDALEAGDTQPIRYPSWYMRHRHFLPGGYLSGRSGELYERFVAPLYNLPSPDWVRSRIAGAVVSAAPRRILELGCGTGGLLSALRRHAMDAAVEGVDLSPFLLDRARRMVSGPGEVELHHANAAEFAVAGRFDAVVAVHLLGHVPLDHARAVFTNAFANLLAAGGALHVVEHRWHEPVWAGARLAESRLLTPLLVHRQYTNAVVG
jgi:SAM-dependent methyltransferase